MTSKRPTTPIRLHGKPPCTARIRRDPISQEASRWLAVLKNADESTEAEFLDWARRSPRHFAAYLLICAEDFEGSTADSHPRNTPTAIRASYLSPRPRKWLALAAAILLPAVLIGAHFIRDAATVSDYKTAVGGLATVPIQDGSVITLNTDSEIKLTLTRTRRQVKLIRGEAFFEVSANPNRPFIVEANGQRLVVLGTKFSIRLQPKALHIAITEGAVRLGDFDPLTAGTVADVDATKISIRHPPMPAIEQSLTWRTGVVELVNVPLPDAVSEWNRYRTVLFVIGDPALESRRVTSSLHINEMDSFEHFLEKTGICFHPRDGRIVLTQCGHNDSPRPSR